MTNSMVDREMVLRMVMDMVGMWRSLIKMDV
jgi:hypothetical protein